MLDKAYDLRVGSILRNQFIVVPKVLITDTTWWACASHLAIALTRSGCDVAAVYPRRGHPLRKTASVQYSFHYSPRRPLVSLANAIREFQPDLIVPSDDRAVRHLHELQAAGPEAFGMDFTPLIQRSLGSPASYPIVSARFPLLETAREEGIRIPETTAIESPNDLEFLRARQAPPWLLKADGSWGGHGVKIARDLEEARRYYLLLSKPLSHTRAFKRVLVDRESFSFWPWRKHGSHVIEQQFIRGVPANSGLFCWEGNVLAAIHVEVLHAQGDTGAATVARVIDNPEMQFAAKQLAARLGLSGFFGLDFVLEEGTGAAYLIEMNPRLTPLCHLQLGEGRDLVEALRAKLTGEPIQVTSPVTPLDTISYFPQAWHWDRAIATRPSAFHDVPWEDPELARDLLRLPWPDRGFLARVFSRLRHTTFAERAARDSGVFEPTADAPGAGESSDPAADALEAARSGGEVQLPSVVPLQREGAREPLFLIHGVDGNVWTFHQLVRRLEPDQPAYGVLSEALLGHPGACTRVEEMAKYYIREIQARHPNGPYHLIGFSFGGLVAFEMARQLHAQGARLGLVGLIDNRQMAAAGSRPIEDANESGHPRQPSRLATHMTSVFSPGGSDFVRMKLRARLFRAAYTLLDALHRPVPRFLQRAYDINWFAAVHYVPQFYPGKVVLFHARDSSGEARPVDNQWLQLAGEGAEVRAIPGGHTSVLQEPQVQFLASEIMDCLSKVECGTAEFQRE